MTQSSTEVPHALATLEHIVKSVVEKPDQVQINVTNDEVGFDGYCRDGDMGRVIGRRRIAMQFAPSFKQHGS